MIGWAEAAAGSVGLATACNALEISRATVYRLRSAKSTEAELVKYERPSPPRALTEDERHEVLSVLDSPRFCDQAPAQAYATLLDEGVYHCSIRTMYRILADNNQVKERRDQLRHPAYAAPELLATRPNQVWSWDITKLLGPVKMTYFYLYVILDIFSRYVVGWTLDLCESARQAERLISQTCAKQSISRNQLTIHADRGPSMKSVLVANLMARLGITQSHSRPHVSNDNPYSESQFKTLKYSPEFPDRFGSYEDAHQFCQGFLNWYNNHHRHSAIGFHTAHNVHYGLVHQIDAVRQRTLLEAFSSHPERFVIGIPQPPDVPEAVWINPPKSSSLPG